MLVRRLDVAWSIEADRTRLLLTMRVLYVDGLDRGMGLGLQDTMSARVTKAKQGHRQKQRVLRVAASQRVR